ncbi:hypothetical protein GEMRC1_000312 [Eukaryota sp. GEM-RC1]
MITPRPEPLLKKSRSSPSRVSSVMSNSDELLALSPSTHSPLQRVHFQQSLLILVHFHLLDLLFKRPKILLRTDPHSLTDLETALPAFFGKVGYVSNHFLDSSFQAVKVYLQLHTFRTSPTHLPNLISLASFFGADLQSVFLHADGTIEIDDFLDFADIITGLRIFLEEPSDLEFLNKYNSAFPRLKQLNVNVIQDDSLAMSLIEALKTNTTVTNIDLEDNLIRAEGATALAEMLKVNTAVTSVNVSYTYVQDVGASALAEALKVNASVTSVDLGGNYIGDEGARALAEALKVNASVTSVVLRGNSIEDEGARALAEALKVNASVTSVDLGGNSIGDEGARALAEALKVNASVTSVDLGGNSIGDEGARALAEALKVNVFVSIVILPQQYWR